LLSFKEKTIASKIYKLLKDSNAKLLNDKIKLKLLKRRIYTLGVSKIDYIKILDINKLIKPYERKHKYKIFIAYYLRNTRLIDNI
jgi:pantothenate synthetase